jgi:hypothetical protein
MGPSKIIGLCVAAALMAWPSAIHAASLKVVNVSAPAVNCVFNASCTIVVSDTTGAIAMPLLASPGTVWLQSRTFTAAAGTPAAGLTGYEYRVSMTQAGGFGDCLLGLVVNFGPVAQLPYQQGQPPAHIYVVTGGGLGTIGLKAAEQEGDIITFEFAQPLCVPASPSASATTFFFGMASSHPPKSIAAGVYGIGQPPFYEVAARAPNH